MLAFVDRNELATALEKARRVSQKKGVIPALANTRIVAENGTLTIQATDLRVGMTYILEANVEVPGSIMVPADTISGIVSSMIDSTIKITVSETDALNIVCGKQRSKILGARDDDFPTIKRYDKDGFDMKAGAFLNMARVAMIAVAKTAARPILNGALLKIENGNAVMVGADGHRLVVYHENGVADSSTNARAVVPLESIRAMVSVLDGEKISMKVMDNNRVGFKSGRTEIVSQTIDGEFPHYEVVEEAVKRKDMVRILISKDDLARAITLAGYMVDQITNHVRLLAIENRLTVSIESRTVGNSDVPIEIEKQGKDSYIGLKLEYLSDAIPTFRTDKIELSFLDPTSPFVMREENNDNYIHIIMPVHVT